MKSPGISQILDSSLPVPNSCAMVPCVQVLLPLHVLCSAPFQTQAEQWAFTRLPPMMSTAALLQALHCYTLTADLHFLSVPKGMAWTLQPPWALRQPMPCGQVVDVTCYGYVGRAWQHINSLSLYVRDKTPGVLAERTTNHLAKATGRRKMSAGGRAVIQGERHQDSMSRRSLSYSMPPLGQHGVGYQPVQSEQLGKGHREDWLGRVT